MFYSKQSTGLADNLIHINYHDIMYKNYIVVLRLLSIHSAVVLW